MSRQLDILALEPFFGGARRSMLESLARFSRNRWNILKLPARELERRLLVAATWFSEVLTRSDVGNVDVLFASETLNLAELVRLVPSLRDIPTIVYFHDNQLPPPDPQREDAPVELVNLTSAMAATEIWFNSLYNLRSFLSRASAVVARNAELQRHDPMADLTAKAHIVPPPVDLSAFHEISAGGPTTARDPRTVLVDARGADHHLISEAFARVAKRKERLKLSVIGRVRGLSGPAVTVIGERDENAQVQSILSAGIVVCTRVGAPTDDLAIRAIASGCHPIVPRDGVYPELLPESLHSHCLHDGTAESLANRLIDAWYLDRPTGHEIRLQEILAQFEALAACRNIDDRIERVVVSQSVQ